MPTTFDFNAGTPESTRKIQTAIGRLVDACRAIARFWDDDPVDPVDPAETSKGLRRAFAESLAAPVPEALPFLAFRR